LAQAPGTERYPATPHGDNVKIARRLFEKYAEQLGPAAETGLR